MCRIDAEFGNLHLDEKSDPTERFIQALDEHEIREPTRALLTKHFAANWRYIFHSVDKLEEALARARGQASPQDQAAALLSSRSLAERLSWSFFPAAIQVGSHEPNSEVLTFAKELAQTLFPESPYTLFKSFKAANSSYPVRYEWFIQALYGDDYCFQRAVFDDPELIAEGELAREEVLWLCFSALPQNEQEGQTELASIFSPKATTLISVASLQQSPTPAARQWLQRLRFLEVWVESDAAAGRLRSPYEGIFEKLYTEWGELRSELEAQRSGESDVKALCDSAINWLDDLELQLKETLAIHMDLSNADEGQLSDWASQLDKCVLGRIIQLPSGEWDVAEQQHLRRLLSLLTSDKADVWIQQSIQSDLEQALRDKEFCGQSSRKWWASDYAVTWQTKFEDKIHNLDVTDALDVLTCRLYRLPSGSASQKFHPWWNSLLEKLIHDPEFPLALTSQWTVAAIDRLSNEVVLPYIDKSLGLLRSRLSNAAEPDLNNQLDALLSRLSHLDPRRALRHRLMLMRSSYLPFADESVSRFSSHHSDKAVSWYSPLSEQARNFHAKKLNGQPYVDRQEREKAELESYQSFALDLIDFCLSRLRLRKGEKKPEDERYADSQVTEQSAIWRQGYLKALLEIGLDPNGKAHKTVFFTRQFDPDESVRDVAKEAYRAVRRETNSKKSVQDYKRGLIAAEWWLLMSQRRALDLPIDPEGALKTRRNMMRNL